MVRNQKFTVSCLAKHESSAIARPSTPQAPRQGARFSSPSLPLLGPSLVVVVRVSSPACSDLLPWQQPFQLWDGHVPATCSPGSALGVMLTSILVFFTDTIFSHIKDAVNFGSPGLSFTLISFLTQDLAGTLCRCVSRSPVISSPMFCLLCHSVVFLEGSKNDYEQLNLEVIRFEGIAG